MPKSNVISDDVRKALNSLEWDGQYGRLTCGQLDRKTYVKVNDVLESFGGKWNKKLKVHVFDGPAQDVVEAAIETGIYVSAADVKQIFGEFETPDAIADLVASEAGPTKGQILEPSAASGQLLKAYARKFGQGSLFMSHAVEIQEKRRDELTQLAFSAHICDFMQWQPENDMKFSLVLMNPPFAKQADVDHVTKAFSHLEDGGRLVAIMSPGWTFRDNSKSLEFTKFVSRYGTWRELPAGSFKESGTGVNTVLVTLSN